MSEVLRKKKINALPGRVGRKVDCKISTGNRWKGKKKC